MTEKQERLRVLVLAQKEMQGQLRRQLAPLRAMLVFIDRASDLSPLTRNGDSYQVALLPAALPDTDWWAVWGAISLLNPRPALLVYTHGASFQLWSGVLEAGGYDVVVEPFTDQEIQQAVLRAAESFDERLQNEKGNE